MNMGSDFPFLYALRAQVEEQLEPAKLVLEVGVC